MFSNSYESKTIKGTRLYSFLLVLESLNVFFISQLPLKIQLQPDFRKKKSQIVNSIYIFL